MNLDKAGIYNTDADFCAVFAAVEIMLAGHKPKKRVRLFSLLEDLVTRQSPSGAHPHQRRAISCLREALARWQDIHEPEG